MISDIHEWHEPESWNPMGVQDQLFAKLIFLENSRGVGGFVYGQYVYSGRAQFFEFQLQS